jgi:predicted sulfurtransferase
VIDVRNSYEAEIGRFAPEHGAEYIDPKVRISKIVARCFPFIIDYIQMRVSTEFPQWAREHIDELRDKQVLMYCTGGIRCERASAYMRALGHEKVYQLKGGIHNYLQEYADKGGGLWIGKNYTFDKRLDAFSHSGCLNLCSFQICSWCDSRKPSRSAKA